VARFGVRRLRIATMAPMAVLLLFVVGVGPFFGLGPVRDTKNTSLLLNETYSARPLAHQLDEVLPAGEIVAVYKVRRDMEYGLSFYRDDQVINYEGDDESTDPAVRNAVHEALVPDAQHVLVVRESYVKDLPQLLQGRSYEPLFTYPAQNLAIYAVSARP